MNKKLFLTFLLVLLVAATLAVSHVEAVSRPVSTPTPTLSPVELYGISVREANVRRVEAWTAAAIKDGSPDYSGMGYESCTADSDCLSGVQTCKAGIIPSSPVLPGYCVPNP